MSDKNSRLRLAARDVGRATTGDGEVAGAVRGGPEIVMTVTPSEELYISASIFKAAIL